MATVSTGRREYTNPALRDEGLLSDVLFVDGNPQEAGFLTFLNMLEKMVVKVPVPRWTKESYLPTIDTTSASVTAGSSLISVSNAVFFIIGDIWFNNRTGEHFTITSVDVSGGQVEAIRGLGALSSGAGTAAAAMDSGDQLFRLSTSVNPQRSTAQTTRTQSLDEVNQFMQAVRYDLNIGREDLKTQYEIERNEHDDELAKALKEARQDLSRQFLWGEKSEWVENGITKRSMQGIMNTPTTHVKDFSGTLHKNDFDSFLGLEAFRSGSKNKILFAGNGLIQSIAQAADGYVEIDEDKIASKAGFGFEIRNYQSAAGGKLKIVEERAISEFRPFDGVIVDMDHVKYMHFSNNGINDDLHLIENSTENDATDRASYIYGQLGLYYGDEKVHSLILNADKGARGASLS